MLRIIFLLSLSVSLIAVSCKKEPENTDVSGCTDIDADNYNANATIDDNSCTYQKRFLGNYDGNFACAGLFSAVFTNAEFAITELINKTKVNMIIQTNIGPLPVEATIIGKDSLDINSTLSNISINIQDIIPGGPEGTVLTDGQVISGLKMSSDAKELTGNLNISLTLKESVIVNGFPLPQGFKIEDTCAFIGSKK